MIQEIKYSVYVLEMERNNGITFGENKSMDCFFMFDYFDVLYYKELTGNEKTYQNYLSIKDPFQNYENYKVSYKVLSLYQKVENIQCNPFILGEEGKLSTTPFIGVIQITLCKDSYKQRCHNIEAFLSECENAILKIVREKIKEKKEKIGAVQIYRSSSTGDFCLVMRTSSVGTIYGIALAINDTQHENQGMKFFTYTNVGIECRVGKDKRYCTFDSIFRKQHKNLNFALRISANTELKKKLEQYRIRKKNGNSSIKEIKGLFGRYDYLFNIDIEEFAQIYPVLCEKKLGKVVNDIDSVEILAEENSLVDILKEYEMQNINERVLVSISDEEENTNLELGKLKAEREEVVIRNKKIYEQIKNLEKWDEYFSEEYRDFWELLRCTKEICRAFLPIGMEQDAYINWEIFCQDMEVLFACINLEMERYRVLEDTKQLVEEERKENRVRVLKNWRINLHAINQYTRLLQNVNYQTYQAPIYEMQTQIDTEKAMVAYRELMENYMLLYYQYMGKKRDKIRTLIYPDMAEGDVRVKAPFAKRLSSEIIRREIICTVPSFEYFGRLYDLLPWLIHECSHHIRVMDRKHRNEYIAKSVLEYIFRGIMHRVFINVSKDDVCNSPGSWSDCLIKAMVKVGFEQLKEQIDIEKVDFECATYELGRYLHLLLRNEYMFLEEKERIWEDQEKIKTEIIEKLLVVGRENFIVDSQYLSLLDEIKGEINAKSRKAIQKLLERILQCYEEQTKQQMWDIEEIREAHFIHLEDFLKPMDGLEECLLQICDDKISRLDAIKFDIYRGYCYNIKNLYQIYKKYKRLRHKEADNIILDDFLEKVYLQYEDNMAALSTRELRQQSILQDPKAIYVMRNLGLQNQEKEVFCNAIKEAVGEIRSKEIQLEKVNKVTQYRETCADLFMAVSLQLNSFGYCRQVFKTISDTRISQMEECYNSVNQERFRIVIAILLVAEESNVDVRRGGQELEIDAFSLIKRVQEYCEYTLKTVRDSILKKNQLTDEEIDLLKKCLGSINNQVAILLKGSSMDLYVNTLLYALLHKGSELKKVQDFYEKYAVLKDRFSRHWGQLRRIEHMILGIGKLVSKGHIIVSKDMFEHMQSIWKGAYNDNGEGCIWEEFMSEDISCYKLAVGRFYNNPKSVFESSVEEKLETTIEFIQNYYYSNRFRIMEQGKDEMDF